MSEFDASLSAFYRELAELRKKHKLPDVYVIVMGLAASQGRPPGVVMSTLAFGSAANQEAMVAWAFGREQANRQSFIAGLVAKSDVLKATEVPCLFNRE